MVVAGGIGEMRGTAVESGTPARKARISAKVRRFDATSFLSVGECDAVCALTGGWMEEEEVVAGEDEEEETLFFLLLCLFSFVPSPPLCGGGGGGR